MKLKSVLTAGAEFDSNERKAKEEGGILKATDLKVDQYNAIRCPLLISLTEAAHSVRRREAKKDTYVCTYVHFSIRIRLS